MDEQGTLVQKPLYFPIFHMNSRKFDMISGMRPFVQGYCPCPVPPPRVWRAPARTGRHFPGFNQGSSSFSSSGRV